MLSIVAKRIVPVTRNISEAEDIQLQLEKARCPARADSDAGTRINGEEYGTSASFGRGTSAVPT
jgi:hypothetical protein